MLDPDSSAEVGQRQVVIEDLPAERDGDDGPRGESSAQNEEPRESDPTEVAESGPAIEAERADELAPLRQWYRFPWLRPDVLGLRANEAVVGALL